MQARGIKEWAAARQDIHYLFQGSGHVWQWLNIQCSSHTHNERLAHWHWISVQPRATGGVNNPPSPSPQFNFLLKPAFSTLCPTVVFMRRCLGVHASAGVIAPTAPAAIFKRFGVLQNWWGQVEMRPAVESVSGEIFNDPYRMLTAKNGDDLQPRGLERIGSVLKCIVRRLAEVRNHSIQLPLLTIEKP